MSRACLVDTTKCIGCRSCQVACKQWNNLSAEPTSLRDPKHGYQNPVKVSAKTYTVVAFHERTDEAKPGGMQWLFTKRQCMHCENPACASACPTTAMHKTPEGPVNYDPSKCIGCRYCVWACPFNVPTADWDSLAPEIHKCTLCTDRGLTVDTFNGKPMDAESAERQAKALAMPSCVKACPSGALKYGERDELLKEAHRRIDQSPDRYVHQVYGEKEVGGTAFLYLSSVPFSDRGFRADLGEVAYPKHTERAMKAVAPAVVGLGALLGAVYWVSKRREKAEQEDVEVEA
jgi:formate dehydrogenase iron-sulfur subunit